jgi:hypothetical protein
MAINITKTFEIKVTQNWNKTEALALKGGFLECFSP